MPVFVHDFEFCRCRDAYHTRGTRSTVGIFAQRIQRPISCGHSKLFRDILVGDDLPRRNEKFLDSSNERTISSVDMVQSYAFYFQGIFNF